MEIKRVNIHPLFFLFGLYYALIGKIAIFVIYTLTALLHELGHSFSAERRGFYLNKITLMPFGAVVSGKTSDMMTKDELMVAFAGPLVNVAIALFFVSLWWIYPPIYSVTDTIVIANLSLAIVNFLPFFPLDGGRILLSILSIKTSREKALLICKCLGVLGGVALLCLFVVSIFYSVNFSLLFFSAFIIVGALEQRKENKYIKLRMELDDRTLKRGIEYKRIGVDKGIQIRRLIALLDSRYLNEIVVYSNGKPFKTISPDKIEKLLLIAELNKPLFLYLEQNI